MSEGSDVRQRLQAALERTRRKIRQHRERKEHIGEEATKTSLILPMLAGLGWDTTDLDEVYPQWKLKTQDNPVDFALMLQRTPRLLLEAKPLDTDLGEHKWRAQAVNYANTAGVEWCVLTDGDTYCIYNSHAPVPVEQKLFRTARVSETTEDGEPAETFGLLSKDRLSDNLLSVLWRAHFVDRNVRTVLDALFDEQDPALVSLLRKRLPVKLGPAEVRASLKRAQVVVDFPVLPSPGVGLSSAPAGPEPPPSGAGTERRRSRSTTDVGDLMSAGLVQSGDTWTFESGATRGQAEVQADGSLLVEGKRYRTPSAAGRAVTGWASFDGWRHWRFEDDSGEWRSINELRARAAGTELVAAHARAAAGSGKQSKFKVQFRWVLEMAEDGGFTLDCRYLADEGKSFQVSGRRVPVDRDFKPARRRLFDDIYQQIKPLFPDLPDGRVRAKAWSGVHKVYAADIYGGGSPD